MHLCIMSYFIVSDLPTLLALLAVEGFAPLMHKLTSRKFHRVKSLKDLMLRERRCS